VFKPRYLLITALATCALLVLPLSPYPVQPAEGKAKVKIVSIWTARPATARTGARDDCAQAAAVVGLTTWGVA
jgi:hypothetical protein